MLRRNIWFAAEKKRKPNYARLQSNFLNEMQLLQPEINFCRHIFA